ncbi:transporter substrate-binding domain-containing protein [Brackiella oedipodis]|uniref:transporter substrate-binding domain-containing protein n=1 Tax=Brackiella oedipodis TaxID=124225 RepID=UPI00048CFC71|nr:transporter substrate-binding domain-containing protein [Brackiella oedipodis]
MKLLKNLLLSALTVSSLAVVAQAHAGDLKELRIGVETAYPPFEFKDTNGQPTGFNVDVGNAICKKLDTQCVWVVQPFDSLIPGLKARKFDMIHSSITVNEARKKVIDFTVPLYSIPSQLVAKKGSQLTPDLEVLKGKKIGVLQGSVQETYARRHWARKGVNVIAYQDQTLTFADLSNGRLDAALIEKPNAQAGFLSKDQGKDFEFVGEPLQHDPILNNEVAIGLRKDSDELKNKVDEAIEALQTDGTIEQLSKKYFKDDEIKFITH